jgi:hypothetical protein
VTRRVLPKLVISLFVGGVFAWLVHRGGVPVIPTQEFSQVDVAWWTLPVYLVTLAVTHFLRGSRWRFLIAPVKKLSLREVILLNWIGFFAIFALPLRLGEVVRPALTKMRQRIPMSAGFGTVAVERVVDGLLTSLCVAWALFVLPRRPADGALVRSLPFYGYLALAVFGSAFAALAMFLWKRQLAVWLVDRTFGVVSPKLGTFLADKVESVADGVRSIGNARLAAGFLTETLGYWACNAFGMWLLGWGCGIPMGYEHAVAIMGILAIGILLPTGPGLFGNFQLAIALALKLYFPPEVVSTHGAVYIFLLYVLQGSFFITAGVIPLYATHISLGELLRVRPGSTG